MGFSLLLSFYLFLPLLIFLFFVQPLLFFFIRYDVLSLGFPLGQELRYHFIKAWLGPRLFNIKPMNHYCILQFHCELSSILLSLEIMDNFTCFHVFHKVLLVVRVFDDVVKSRLSSFWINQLCLFLVQALVQLVMFLSQSFYCFNVDHVNAHCLLALCICVNPVIHEERIVIYN